MPLWNSVSKLRSVMIDSGGAGRRSHSLRSLFWLLSPQRTYTSVICNF